MNKRNKFTLLLTLLVLLPLCSQIPHSFALDVSRPTINADDVHQLGYTGEGVTVAIIDSGIDFNHPDFQGAIKTSWNILNNNATLAQDTDGHGTHVAGVVAGRGVGDSRYLGIAPGAELVIVRITTGSQIPVAIQWCIDNKDNYDISIITLSWMYQLGPCDGLCVACKKVDYAIDAGIVFVKSAGNQYGGDITCPGSAFNVITVGASDDHDTVTTSDDTVADLSSHGPTGDGRPGLDVVAPGVNIMMPRLGGGYSAGSGTSFAAPHVAGTLALILQKNPNWTPNKVKDALRNPANTVDLGYDRNTQGTGLIDAYEAVQASPDGSWGWDPFHVKSMDGTTIKFDIDRDKNVIALRSVYVKGLHMCKSVVTPYIWIDSPDPTKLTDNHLVAGPRVLDRNPYEPQTVFTSALYAVGGLDIKLRYDVCTVWVHPWVSIVSNDGQYHDFDLLGYYDVDLRDAPNDCPQWTSGGKINNEISYSGTDQFYVKRRRKVLWWWAYPKPWLRFDPHSLDNPKTWILKYESAGYTDNPDAYLNGEAVWGQNIVIYYKASYDNKKSAVPIPSISIIE